MSTDIDELLTRAQALAPEFEAWRRDIHQHPELGFEEHRTSERVAEALQRWGYQVTRGLGGTGVMGQLTTTIRCPTSIAAGSANGTGAQVFFPPRILRSARSQV